MSKPAALLVPILIVSWLHAVEAAPRSTSNTKGPVVIEVDTATMAAAKALGEDTVFYTRRGSPLKNLSEIKSSGSELGIWGVELINGTRTLIEAAGGKFGGGEGGLVRVIGDAYFPKLFKENPKLRLFITHKRDDHREAAIERSGGGLQVIFKPKSATTDLAASTPEEGEPDGRVGARAHATVAECVDLAPEDAKAGTILIEIHRPDVPQDWSVNWHFAVYSPKGVRVGLGRIEDSSKAPGALAVRIPVGRHRLEVTRTKADQTPMIGMFDFSKRKWMSPSDETEVMAAESVAVSPSSVTLATFAYDAPSVQITKGRVNQTKLMLARNPRISSHVDANLAPPAVKAKVHPFVAGGRSFSELDHAAVIQVLLGGTDGDQLATTALLKTQKTDVNALVGALGSKAAKPSWGLARVAAHVHDGRLVEPLLAMLGRTPADQRASLYWALGELGDARALTALTEAANGGPSLGKVYATYALGRLHDAKAVEALARAVEDKACVNYQMVVRVADPEMNAWYARDPDSSWEQFMPLPGFCVQRVAIYGLGQVGGDKALDVLLPLTSSDDEDVRIAACQGLCRFRSPAAVRALASRIEDKASVQFIAAAALGAIGTPAAKAALKKFAAEGKDETTRSIAKAALGKKPPKR